MILCKKNRLHLEKTFECGQCFRWNPVEPHSSSPIYVGVFRRALLIASEEDDRILLRTPQELSDRSEKQVSPMGLPMEHYFDLQTDYDLVESTLLKEAAKRKDGFMEAAVKYCRGLRILRQDPFETLISFMISANNNIPKIKLTIEDLCKRFGDPAGEFQNRMYYTFPTAEQLSENRANIHEVKAIGYRAQAIAEAAEKVVSGVLRLEELTSTRTSYESALSELKTLYGVGEKVANCVALFGLGHRSAFPIDTWIRRVLDEQYHVRKDLPQFVKKNFTAYPGIAQQYLFFYLREIKRNKEK